LCVIGLIALLPHQLGGPGPQQGPALPEFAADIAAELCRAQPSDPDHGDAARLCAFCCSAVAVTVPGPVRAVAVRVVWAATVPFVPARAPPGGQRAELPVTGPRAPPLLA
jgi:hypothetical protein